MRRIILSASLLALSLIAGLAQVPAFAAKPAAPLELAANAPERHVVVPGDTLWGISAKFLKQPYRWPELWRMNADEVKNPHRIYPGQVLVLERDADGRPRLRTAGTVKLDPQIYVTPQKTAISAIPYDVIEPYLAYPKVMDPEQSDMLPRVIALPENRTIVGAGDTIHVTGITDKTLNWEVYRPGDALKDPGSREILGYEMVHIGSARLQARGDPAKLVVTRSKSEIVTGDRLTPQVEQTIANHTPRVPQTDITARVVGVYDAVGLGGQYSVLSLSRGKRDGLERGHVLALETAGHVVDDRFNGIKTTYETPPERSGLIYVFQVFDRVSYALVMTSDNHVKPGDVVRTP